MVLKKIAVTGASGLVGRHLLAALSRRGIACACACRTRPSALPTDATWAPWDLEDWKRSVELDRLFPGVDAVLHVGAMVPAPGASVSARATFDANVRASLSLGEWARGNGVPLLYLSGAIVYGDPERVGIRETDPVGMNGIGGLYGLTKLQAEQVLTHLSRSGLSLCVLRPSSIYGDGLPAGKMITDFLMRASEGKALELSPPADDQVNMIHASDVAEAMLDAVTHDAWGGVFNIGTPRPVTVREIAEACVAAVGSGRVVLRPGEAERPARVRFALVSDLASAKFGFTTKMDLGHGLNDMWERMRAAH